jgi:tetratricopeptide (TPR) repeat protein
VSEAVPDVRAEALPPVPARSRRGLERLVGALSLLLALGCIALAIFSAVLWWRILQWRGRIDDLQAALSERRSVQQAVEREPGSAPARVRLGIYLAEHGQREAAGVQFSTAYALAPDEPLTAYSYGRFLLETGDKKRAVAPLERAVAGDPKNATARVYLGLARLDLDEPEAARREFEEATRLDPSLPEAHLGVALVSTDRATAAKAVRELNEYIRLARNPASGRVLLSRTYHELHQVPEAIAAGRQATVDQPDNFQTWQALGLALMEGSLAEREEAERCFRRAIELAPRFGDAYVGLARVYLRRRDYPRAVKQLETALRIDPGMGYVRYELGQAYRGAGRKREAEAEFKAASEYMAYKRQVVAARRAIVAKPGSAALYVKLAKLYASHGAYDFALPAMERAVQLAPADAAVKRELRRAQEMARE